ncbi:hypothetical protein BDV93DRAFT_466029 [Ceratobasidium sp. AG-I]|nr:hypothetical protein BDV93DRAFT_466029 [Ceratobasidium sp. AG-I]
MRSALAGALGLLGAVRAYIPAQGTNQTEQLNLADASSLKLTWPPMGIYMDEVSYQLARTNSSGYEVGAIVHFTEDGLKEFDYSPTPWVALISCDKNATNTSMEIDIFTSAQERGAVAALLYSTQSEACVINEEYTQPGFDQIIDIFATKKKSAARLIENQFTNVNSTYSSFNSKRLNDSFAAVASIINDTSPRVQPPFLLAILRAWNATNVPNTNITDTDPSATSSDNSSKPNTGLAMIVLYAITGCVSVLFCVVILSGAIRAIRHPERYGPRSGDPNIHGPGGAPQSRAGGLTRAILDTFPVVKFGRPPADRGHYSEQEAKDFETKSLEMTRTSGASELERGAGATVRLVDAPDGTGVVGGAVRRPQPVASGSAPPSPTRDEVTRAAIGVETCPICIVDFEDGDDLRVLPCEGRHRFHRDCVDQWLLELSSSCPLCREDFGALEAMAAGNSPDAPPVEHPHTNNANRFSKYLRFAQRHRRNQTNSQDSHEHQAEIDRDPEHETTAGWRPRVHGNGSGSHL